MSTEIKTTKKKWPYLWYDPETGLPFDFKPDNRPPKSPNATRTSKLREELLLKKSSEVHLEPLPRHILTAPTTISAGTTKTQRLREMRASKMLQEQKNTVTPQKANFKARIPPPSTREEVIPPPHKTTNSQRLREEHSRKIMEKQNDDNIITLMETQKRIMSVNVDTSPARLERKRSEISTVIKKSQKNILPIKEKKTKTNPRPIRGTAKKSATSLKMKTSQSPSLSNKKTSKTNLARERYNSEPKLHGKGKRAASNQRNPIRKQESLSTNATKPQGQSLVAVDKVNKVISKNRVNFLKEKMKRLNIDEGKNTNKPSYTEECLKMLNQSRAILEESDKASGTRDKNFKVILPPTKQRRMQEPCSPSSKIRRLVQDALSTTGDDDSSGSEA